VKRVRGGLCAEGGLPTYKQKEGGIYTPRVYLRVGRGIVHPGYTSGCVYPPLYTLRYT